MPSLRRARSPPRTCRMCASVAPNCWRAMSGRPRPGRSASGRAFKMTHQPMQEGWLTTYEEVTDQRASEARMVHLAHHDALTDLPNRVLFRQKLEHALAYARQGGSLALLCLDLDQFKAVNDTLGHPVGDELLRAVAERLAGQLRETDTVARLGGDEFAIVQSRIEKPTEATAFAAPPDRADRRRRSRSPATRSSSAPVSALPSRRRTARMPTSCCSSADLALYRAKSDGRGVYRLFHAEMDAQMQARRLLELDLRQALGCGQLEVFYQPVISLHDRRRRRVRGAAALAPSAARPRSAERVHPAGRGDRPDHADRRVGAATGLRRRRLLAWHADGRGQSLVGAVQEPQSGACRGHRIARIGAATQPARAGDHRNRDAGGYRRDGGDTE